ncbi:ubiquinol oxidase subunit II [Novosphingobium resinovorum]|uniref:ubiquinol oxidase subunit II n=1 Tax=Novosphingobium TaxID=165696 RepID=UPI0025A0E8A3|nr:MULTISPECIES: ubiquinol oxidase subunit II [Novosphingobium]MBF7013852.1 ubiquinol oxidase subunit II [Novosphingobium sp. HR1a]WJM25997.1 ubiquinol oxidase subunit II [Novosphingobium resinovorum]
MNRALPGRFLHLASALLAGCGSHSVLSPGGPIAAGNRQIMLDALGIMLAIVVPTMIASVWFAWWFRAGNPRARYKPSFVYSGRIEMIVWSIPILVILFLGGVIYIGSHDLDPARPIASTHETVEVQVVSLDWKWLFIYPREGVASVNRLVVPAGVPVRFRLTSASVMNVFFVPRLGTMIYAMNGMETKLHLMADKPEQFYGQSAHFSGDGFPGMKFTVHALPPDRFAQWSKGVRGNRLDAAAYARLARQSSDVPAFDYSSVVPGLFDGIVSHRIAPAAGPGEGRGGPGVSPEPLS